MAYLAQASENAKRKDGVGGTWAQDYYLPTKADGWVLTFFLCLFYCPLLKGLR